MKNPLLQNSASDRVRRGGCWDFDAWNARVSNRSRDFASLRGDYQSFRLFRTKERS